MKNIINAVISLVLTLTIIIGGASTSALAAYSADGLVAAKTLDVTDLITPPTNILRVDRGELYTSLLSLMPATAVFIIDGELNAVDAGGGRIASLAEAYASLEGKVIAGFEVADSDTAEGVIAFLEEVGAEDVTFFSRSEEVVAYIRSYAVKKERIYRAVLDFSDYEVKAAELDAAEVRDRANGAGTKIVLLPKRLATADNVAALQGYFMTVWVRDFGGLESESEALWLITSGANGIVSDAPALIEETAKKYLTGKNPMTRTPLIIAHRGASTLAPENTLEAFLAAYEAGADMIELDIHLTKDREIIVLHDERLAARTTEDRTLPAAASKVATLTLAEVQSIPVDKGFTGTEYEGAVVPTLESVFEAFKELDPKVKLLIEYKVQSAELGRKLAELIKKYDFDERVNSLTYSSYDYPLPRNALAAEYPGISVSRLCGSVIKSATGEREDKIYEGDYIYSPLKAALCFNSTLSPQGSYITRSYYNIMAHRGMGVFPWTASHIDFNNWFMIGTAGITTDYCQLATDMVKKIRAGEQKVYLSAGESEELKVGAETYGGEVTEISAAGAELIMVGNDGCVEYKDGKLTAIKNGRASFIWKYTAATSGGKAYTLYTQPVTVTVFDENPAYFIIARAANFISRRVECVRRAALTVWGLFFGTENLG